ncbi:hypothetical protein LXD69_07290 [Flavobacterium sediminilitoris]|uniref:Uncharacterized protein n=1 Tax=Flavobacterium sediminilitoris TaxID=2024526 RepID=A0ABY4HRS3_9FLAO|nr:MULTISPECIES: hypothetical protein [Flavobacterium]UOX35315.1 hypothetical protein LXD69_07290 [Flavobacterium sediminilitoris]
MSNNFEVNIQEAIIPELIEVRVDENSAQTAQDAAALAADILTQIQSAITGIDTRNTIIDDNGFTKVDEVFTAAAASVWDISGIEYTNPAEVIINIPLAVSGMQRWDRIVLNTSNTFQRIAGVEASENPAIDPVPDNTLDYTFFLVTDSEVGDATPPLVGGQFVKKIFSNSYAYPASGSNAVIELRPDGSSYYTLTNSSLVSLSGFKKTLITGVFSAEEPYNNKEITIFNKTGVAFTINNLEDSAGNIPFFLKGGVDLVFPPNENITFLYSDSGINEKFRSWVTSTNVDVENLFKAKGDLYMCQVTGSSFSNIGYPLNPSTIGTPAYLTANLSADYNTSPYSTWNLRRSICANVAGNTASFVWPWKNVSVGLGFYVSAKVNVNLSLNGRFFFGLTDSTSSIGNVNPSSLTNILGFAIDSLDLNLQIINNDSTGIATKTDLGSDFSINSTDDNTYIIEIWNKKNSNNCSFRVLNLLNNVISSEITITEDLPVVTDGLAFQLWLNNGIDSTFLTLHFSNHTLIRSS